MAAEDQQAVVMSSSTRQRLPHAPRLSIAHILFITMMTAAALSAPLDWDVSTTESSFRDLAHLIFFRLCTGVELAGLMIIAWHAGRRTLWPLEPGEWLLLAIGGSSLLGVLYQILYGPTMWNRILDHPHFFQTLLRLASFGNVVWLVLVAVAARRYGWWSGLIAVHAFRAFFGSLVFATASWFAGFSDLARILLTLWPGETALELILLGLAVVSDRRSGSPRHWLHWLGVALFGLSNIVILFLTF